MKTVIYSWLIETRQDEVSHDGRYHCSVMNVLDLSLQCKSIDMSSVRIAIKGCNYDDLSVMWADTECPFGHYIHLRGTTLISCQYVLQPSE